MSVKQYLQRYAEPEVDFLDNIHFKTSYKHCLVIPACDEKPDFIARALSEFSDLSNLLLIVIINQSDNSNQKTNLSNKALAGWIDSEYSKHASCSYQNIRLYAPIRNNGLLVVDRFTKPIPDKQGVGLARKIINDIALALIQKKVILNPWIANTDADAYLPNNYFKDFHAQGKNTSAITFNFKHQYDDSPVGFATRLYEQHLHYYRAGLEWAGSPYAFFTLGSTLAVHAEHYAKVRGFPKRSGGEDFYILNKLAKTGDVVFERNIKLALTARNSDRVPFGTGPAVKTIMALENPQIDYLTYNPKCFEALKELLDTLPEFYQKDYQLVLSQLTKPLQQALTKLKFLEGLAHSKKQATTQEQFLKHLHQWLDGFRTLKLIHHLRNSGDYADVPLCGIKTAYFPRPNTPS